jgi:hypothetical protein
MATEEEKFKQILNFKGPYFFYFKCEECNYGIKKKGSEILVDFFTCPLCESVASIIRASYDEYKKCKVRDKW